MAMILNEIQHGDARELAKSIPDESIDMIFTDPLYDRMDDYKWLAQTAVRVLKPKAAALVFCGIGFAPETMDALREGGLRYRWELSLLQMFRSGAHAPCGFSQFTKCLWFDVQGESKPNRQVPDVRSWQPAPEWFAKIYDPAKKRWFQDPNFVSYYMTAFTNEGDTVADFFSGSGTIPAVCKAMNRNFWASEIEKSSSDFGNERVQKTSASLMRLPTLPAPDGGDSAPSQALSTPDMFSAIEHEPTPAPRR